MCVSNKVDVNFNFSPLYSKPLSVMKNCKSWHLQEIDKLKLFHQQMAGSTRLGNKQELILQLYHLIKEQGVTCYVFKISYLAPLDFRLGTFGWNLVHLSTSSQTNFACFRRSFVILPMFNPLHFFKRSWSSVKWPCSIYQPVTRGPADKIFSKSLSTSTWPTFIKGAFINSILE